MPALLLLVMMLIPSTQGYSFNICRTDLDEPDIMDPQFITCLGVTVPTAGYVLLVIIQLICCACCCVCKRKRKKKRQEVSLLNNDAEPSSTLSSVETPILKTRGSQVVHGLEEVDAAQPVSKSRELAMYEEVVVTNHQRTNSQDLSASKNNYDMLEEYREKKLPPSSNYHVLEEYREKKLPPSSNYHVLEEYREESVPTLEGTEELHTYETVSECKARKVDMDAAQKQLVGSRVSHAEEIHRKKVSDDKQCKEIPDSHVSADGAENQYDVIGPNPTTVNSPVRRGIVGTPLKESSVEEKSLSELEAHKITSTTSEEAALILYDTLDPPAHSFQVSFLQKESKENDHKYQVLEEANLQRTNSARHYSTHAEINKSIKVIHSSFHDIFSLHPHSESTDTSGQKKLSNSPESKENPSVVLFDDPMYSPFTSTDKRSTKKQQPGEANGTGSDELRHKTEKESCVDSHLHSPVSSEEASAKASQEQLLPERVESAARLFDDPLYSLAPSYKRNPKEMPEKVSVIETVV